MLMFIIDTERPCLLSLRIWVGGGKKEESWNQN